MNFCMPYSAVLCDLMRCLFSDLNIDYTQPPVPSKYTLQIGKSYSSGTLCSGLESALGSLAECRYLGADAALIFAPCGGCSAQRIKSRLQNSLESNGLKMELLAFSPKKDGAKELFKLLKVYSDASPVKRLEIKKDFCECTALLCEFEKHKEASREDETVRAFILSAQKQLRAAKSVKFLKILLKTFNRKLSSLSFEKEELQKNDFPYSSLDFFSVTNRGSSERESLLSDYFTKKKAPLFSQKPAFHTQTNCPEGGEFALYLGR